MHNACRDVVAVARQVDSADPVDGDLEMLNGCLEELSEHQKYCISSFYLEEKAYKDISAELGISLGSVRSQIQNGRRNLKNCMTEKLNKLGDERKF